MISLPVCKTISAYAFYPYPYNSSYNMALSKIIAPQCENIENNAFNHCINLSSFGFTSALRHIGYRAFANCGSYISSFPFELLNTAASIEGYLFEYGQLTTLSHSTLNKIPFAAFTNCSLLSLLSLPMVTKVFASGFAYCSNISSINLPECTELDSYAFAYCSDITYLSLPKCTSIASTAFIGCNFASTTIDALLMLYPDLRFNSANYTTLTLSGTSIPAYAFASC